LLGLGQEQDFQPRHGICEPLWMKIILDDLKVKTKGLVRLFFENNSTISVVHNPIQHEKTKHIMVDRRFIKEKLDNGLMVTARLYGAPIGRHVHERIPFKKFKGAYWQVWDD